MTVPDPDTKVPSNTATDNSTTITKRIYIGGLNTDVDEAALENRFKSFGKVTSVSVAKGDTHKGCRGFGHIVLETTPSAFGRCVSTYNGTKWKGMQMRIEEAKQDFTAK
ncbi:hypothetical protein DFS34DRAFT_574848 [Phlyctochytrium arcticum]|nr:hypothetical protein DFS34DRAFT_574848 [Phlyctochytrium arcticum]